jgi:hypothetical protein
MPQDLVYGANSSHAVSDRASVTAVIEDDDKKEIFFTRTYA